ncbi:MAG: AMP-binding protein, partial [Polyangiales bacterium]
MDPPVATLRRMPVGCSTLDASTSPPRLHVPRDYNAAVDLLDRHVVEGRGARIAVVDDDGRHSYEALADRANRAGNALRALGLDAEQRVMLCLLDTVDFPAAFLGAIKSGAIPVPVNTLLSADDYVYLLGDSRARVLLVSDALLPKLEKAIAA